MTSNLPCTELTETERRILRLLAKGHTQAQIADQTGYSLSHTEKLLGTTEARSIYAKIGVKNQREAVAWYKDNCRDLESREDRAEFEGIEPTVQDQVPMVLPVGESDPPQKNPYVPLETGSSAQSITGPIESTISPLNTSELPKIYLPKVFLYSFTTLYVCIVLLTFLPGLLRGGGDDLDKIYVNIYILIPAVAGAFGFAHFQNQEVDSMFFRTFRLFSIGLICWAIGGAIWAILDLVEGLETHYPSFADIGYGTQTIIQTICFYFWWREVCKRAGKISLTWVPIALVLIVVYYAALYSVRNATEDLLTNTPRFALDIMYTLGDSLSLSWAISLLLPWSIILLTDRMKIVMSFLAAGMIGMFVAGSGFYITTSLPLGDSLHYGSGGWVDLIFATALFFFGISIAVASSCNRAFLRSSDDNSRGQVMR